MWRNPAADKKKAAPDSRDIVELRGALLSVYYASLGSQFEVRGAPSVYMPPQINLLSLDEALGLLKRKSPTRFREALWLLLRESAVKGPSSDVTGRYPPAVENYVEKTQRDRLAELRKEYRSGTTLFAAALYAVRDGNWERVALLSEALRDTRPVTDISDPIAMLFQGRTASRLLDDYGENDKSKAAATGQIRALEREVGMNLNEFVVQFADAVAFHDAFRDTGPAGDPSGTTPGTLTVFPVTSLVIQDTRTLATTVTVTTIVTGDFDRLCDYTDPLAWPGSSDVVKSTQYVPDPFSDPADEPEGRRTYGQGFSGSRLLDERAEFAWGQNDDQRAAFHNILRVTHDVRRDASEIDVTFTLGRSIDSEVLWDRRAGGLLANQGFIKVRPLGNHKGHHAGLGPLTWRVNWQKRIRFSDRTPGPAAQGWTDFGQLLNFMAPTALTWWVESETYSLGDRPDSAPEEFPTLDTPLAGRQATNHDTAPEWRDAWSSVGRQMQTWADFGGRIVQRNLGLWSAVNSDFGRGRSASDVAARSAARVWQAGMQNVGDLWTAATRLEETAGYARGLPTIFISIDVREDVTHVLIQPDEVLVPDDVSRDAGFPPNARIALNGTTTEDNDIRGVTALNRWLAAGRVKGRLAYGVVALEPDEDADRLVPGVYDGLVYLDDPPMPLASLRIVVLKK